jgi:5-methylthioribose kinase
VAIFGPDGFPLTSERMQREMDVYDEWKALLGAELTAKYLPNIYYFDKSHMVVVMEFLDGYDLLDHVLVDHAAGDYYHPQVATSLGDFMGKTHAQTHSSKVDDERRAYLTQHFENREMRDIQLEFVFTKCYKEATDEQRSGLTLTPAFMKEVELLKNQYNGQQTDSLVLTHGDLHPGSVMVDSNGNTKVIDPEFTVYGPPGLDVGSLLSGYCLGAIHQAFSNNPQAVERIVDGAQAIWDAYSKAMMEGGISQDLLKEIEIESVGFTVAEVCRTALEFAGGRKWLQFEDAEVKSAAKKAALQVVDKCMVARHTGGMDLLLNEMKAVSLSK